MCLSLANQIYIQNEPEQPKNIVVYVISFIYDIYKKNNKMFVYIYKGFIGSDSSI